MTEILLFITAAAVALSVMTLFIVACVSLSWIVIRETFL